MEGGEAGQPPQRSAHGSPAVGSPVSRPDAGLVLDLAPDAIIGVRQDGRIEFTNTRVESTFGYSRSELAGKPIEELMPERYRSRHETQRAAYFQDGRTRAMGAGMELWGLRKDGSEFRCEIALSEMVDDHGPLAIAAIREATAGGPALAGDGAADAAGLLDLIEGERVTAVFQPIVRLETGEVVGHEALARFEIDPDEGPLHWFQRAAEFGLTTRLELLAMQRAVSAFAEHETNHGESGTFLSLNASPETLRLGSVILEMLAEPVASDRIVVEVTEHAEIADYADFDGATEELWDGDIRLAVDDVGAGYASLRHLLKLEPDFIKLDLTLTRGIDQDPRRRAIARGLIAFAHEADCIVIAEGIESDDEIEALRKLGVDLGQGYRLGRPGPLGAER